MRLCRPRLTIPSVEGEITIQVIADAAVDPEFGTGVVKVTPAHDPQDFDIGRRHGLEIRQVIGFDGRMNAAAGSTLGSTASNVAPALWKTCRLSA